MSIVYVPLRTISIYFESISYLSIYTCVAFGRSNFVNFVTSSSENPWIMRILEHNGSISHQKTINIHQSSESLQQPSCLPVVLFLRLVGVLIDARLSHWSPWGLWRQLGHNLCLFLTSGGGWQLGFFSADVFGCFWYSFSYSLWYRMIGCLKFYNRLLDLFLSSPWDGTKLVGSWTARHFFSVPFPEVLQPNIALLMCYRGKPHWLNPVSLPGSKIIKHLGIHTFFPMYCSKVWSVLWHITFDYRSLYDLIWSLIHLLAIGTKSKPTRVWYYSIQFHEPWIADLCSQTNIWLEHTVLYSTGIWAKSPPEHFSSAN